MEARFLGAARPLVATATAIVGLFFSLPVHAAGYRTTNFVVDAPTPALAKEIGDTAEVCRKSLSIDWLGYEIPQWAEPCPIKASVSPRLGAGGATSFVFSNGDVSGWRMNIQGSRERVLDSVLPHEVTHTIFATHFRQPLPRWADEGACTTVEHDSEVSKQERMLMDFLKVRPGHPGRGIPFSDMFAMTEYPQDVLPLYAQGHSLSVFLIGQKGKREFLSFLADGMNDSNWPRAIKAHYGYEHLLALQNSWLDWVKAGRPQLTPAGDGATMLAGAAVAPTGRVPASMASTTMPVLRSKSPADPPPAPAAASPNSSAQVTPTPGGDAYADWSTRPARHTMNVAPGEPIRAADGRSGDRRPTRLRRRVTLLLNGAAELSPMQIGFDCCLPNAGERARIRSRRSSSRASRSLILESAWR